MDVGVCTFWEFEGEEPFARGRSPAEEDVSGSMRWDLRLWWTIILTAHAARSTGVRFAAWMKGSVSWQ
jgi:hypothetical protein